MNARRDTHPDFPALASHQSGRAGIGLLLVLGPAPVAVLAPHGGGIEPGTSELARATAGDDFSLYTFEGLRDSGNQSLHVTSTNFNDPACLALLRLCDRVLAYHGCAGHTGQAHVGGLDQPLIRRLITELNTAGFPAVRDRSSHAGEHPRNLCNLGRTGRGAQLELDQALRSSLFAGLDRPGRRWPTPAFHRLVTAVRTALLTQHPATG